MQATTETICRYCEMTGYFADEIVGATEEELQEEIANMITKEE